MAHCTFRKYRVHTPTGPAPLPAVTMDRSDNESRRIIEAALGVKEVERLQVQARICELFGEGCTAELVGVRTIDDDDFNLPEWWGWANTFGVDVEVIASHEALAAAFALYAPPDTAAPSAGCTADALRQEGRADA